MAELIWDGKYKDGKKVAPVKILLPFQTVETVYESAQQRQKSLDLYASGKKTEWRNRLIWGDKKYVLPSLLEEFAGKVNLIYIDPPFDTGADFSFTTKIPESDESFTKEPSIIEQKAYRDTWGRGIDSYLEWFYETAVLLRELLADNGSIYVHLDWHIGQYAKIVLDDIFGYLNFRNEVIVKRVKKNVREREMVKSLNVAFDSILFYAKSEETKIKPPTRPEPKEARWHSFDAAGFRTGMDYELFGKRPAKDNHWRWTKEKADLAIKKRRLRANPKSGNPEYLIDASKEVLCDSLWNDIQAYTFKYDYPTEKNEELLKRILNSSTNPNDLVIDCFIGSGTTASVAEKLGRRWIACDLGRFAIHTTRKRLLQIEGCKPFIVQNLGKYERQAWQGAEFENAKDAQAKEAAYRKFILELYHAEPISGHSWLHGIKAGKMVHVGGVDAPVTFEDVKSICAEVWKAAGKGTDSPKKAAVDILGWDFGFEVNETAKQMAAEANVQAKFKHIPREVMEKQAVDAGDIHFYELAALDVKIAVNKMTVSVKLKDFMMPQDDVPADIRKVVKEWRQWIDYWAIDWDFKEDTFHNVWQSYRTKKEPDLQLKITNKYESKGKYTIVIKVIDILGNDTTKTVEIEIK